MLFRLTQIPMMVLSDCHYVDEINDLLNAKKKKDDGIYGIDGSLKYVVDKKVPHENNLWTLLYKILSDCHYADEINDLLNAFRWKKKKFYFKGRW